MTTKKFNITLGELEDIVEFAKLKGDNEYCVVTLYVTSTAVGSVFEVSEEWDSEKTNVTNYDTW